MHDFLSIRIDSMRYPGAGARGHLMEGLCLEVPQHSVVSLLGRSGIGKTTLLRIVAGLERRFEGEVKLGDDLICRAGRRIQIVFQDYRLLPWKTVFENVAFASREKDAKARRAEVEKWLELVGLQDKRHAWPKTLSGGEAGRVAFARAFVDQPEVLLLDEPFRGLDLLSKVRVQEALLAALREQPATVLLVSHSVEDAVFLSDTVHLLGGPPTAVERTCDIKQDWPRERGSQVLAAITNEVAALLMNGILGGKITVSANRPASHHAGETRCSSSIGQ